MTASYEMPFDLIAVLYVCICLKARDRNFNFTKFGTQVGLVKSKVQLEDGLCGSHRSANTFLQNLENLIKIANFIRLSYSVKI